MLRSNSPDNVIGFAVMLLDFLAPYFANVAGDRGRHFVPSGASWSLNRFFVDLTSASPINS